MKFPDVVDVQLFLWSVYSNGDLVRPWETPVFEVVLKVIAYYVAV